MVPVYDNGAGLFPRLNTDSQLTVILVSEKEINQRVFRFPTSHIKVQGRKSSYYEVISSLQFPACNDALRRIVPRIEMNRISGFIEGVEGLSEVRKEFYNTMLRHRFEKILLTSYKAL